MNYKIKIIVGFRRDQEHSIPADEAHKAYYLFLHPEARTIFSTGLAIKGDQIQEIVPDYQGTMGWSMGHILGPDDWNEINSSGVARSIQALLSTAKSVAEHATADELNTPLPELISKKYPQLAQSTEPREGGMKHLADVNL